LTLKVKALQSLKILGTTHWTIALHPRRLEFSVAHGEPQILHVVNSTYLCTVDVMTVWTLVTVYYHYVQSGYYCCLSVWMKMIRILFQHLAWLKKVVWI